MKYIFICSYIVIIYNIKINPTGIKWDIRKKAKLEKKVGGRERVW